MAVEEDVLRRIINFHPGNASDVLSAQEIHLGRVDGCDIFYGRFSYQERVQQLAGEPLTPKWTKQPVVAVIKGEQVTTLAYATDVRRLGEPLATAVARRLELWNKNTWPEDF